MAKNDLAVPEGGGEYPALVDGGATAVLEALRENVGGQPLSITDFDRVNIPGGGGTLWAVPSLEGTDDIRELEGIIVSWTSPRAYWAESGDDKEPSPPDCASDEGEIGLGEYGPGSEGNPSGRCEVCPMNEWGSADPTDPKNRGKACKEMRQLLLLRPGQALPVVVTLPPTSIQPLRKYFLRLANEGIPYYGVVSKLSLETQTSGSMRWSTAAAKMLRRLDHDELNQVKAYSDQMKAAIASGTRVPEDGTVPPDA